MKTEQVLAIPQMVLGLLHANQVDLTGAIFNDMPVPGLPGKFSNYVIQGERHLFEVCGILDQYAHFISYILFYDTKGENGGRRFFQYERTTTSGEALLKGCRSLGVGGHVNTEYFNDYNRVLSSACWDAAQREVTEEVCYAGSEAEQIDFNMKMLNDIVECGGFFFYHPVNPVSKVHIGYTCAVEVDDVTKLKPAEDKLKAVEPFIPGVSDPETLEAWSSHVLEKLQEKEGLVK